MKANPEFNCMACCESLKPDDGLVCQRGVHFLCTECMNSEVKMQLQPDYQGQFGLNNKKIVCRECVRVVGKQPIRLSFFQSVVGCFFGFMDNQKYCDGKRFAYETRSLLKTLNQETSEQYLRRTYEEGYRNGAIQMEASMNQGRRAK